MSRHVLAYSPTAGYTSSAAWVILPSAIVSIRQRENSQIPESLTFRRTLGWWCSVCIVSCRVGISQLLIGSSCFICRGRRPKSGWSIFDKRVAIDWRSGPPPVQDPSLDLAATLDAIVGRQTNDVKCYSDKTKRVSLEMRSSEKRSARHRGRGERDLNCGPPTEDWTRHSSRPSKASTMCLGEKQLGLPLRQG